MLLFLPEYVKKQLKILHDNGFKAYVVGGCVRDLLMNRLPFDYDIATSALPHQIEALFERCIPTGIKHGTVSVVESEGITEITTFRTEGDYRDSRRPDSVAFVGDLESDLLRRDFTINALAYNDNEGVIDLFSGIKDLENKILRAVGNPEERFKEDALRIMRLFRFSAQLDLSIERETLEAALLMQKGLESISRERIGDELKKIVCSANPGALLPLVENGGLSFLGIKKFESAEKMALLPCDLNIRLAAFLILCKVPLNSVKDNLRLQNKQTQYLYSLKLLSTLPLKTKADIKLALNKTSKDILSDFLVLKAILTDENTEKVKALLEEILSKNEPYKISRLDIKGEDLLALGLKNNEVGKALNRLLELVINEPEKNNKQMLIEALLEYTQKH